MCKHGFVLHRKIPHGAHYMYVKATNN